MTDYDLVADILDSGVPIDRAIPSSYSDAELEQAYGDISEDIRDGFDRDGLLSASLQTVVSLLENRGVL